MQKVFITDFAGVYIIGLVLEPMEISILSAADSTDESCLFYLVVCVEAG